MDRASVPIFLSVTFPAVNGITTFSIYLARALARLGYPTRILLTEADTTLATYDERSLEIPADVTVERLPVGRADGWGAHWGSLIRHLHDHAPCVYVPNSDFRHSVVSPALRPEVLIVGVAHADEPLHYDHVARLGRYWNAIVCVSQEIADGVCQRHPELRPRVRVIRNGIEMPASYPTSRSFDGPLRLVYHGAFKQQQKRVLEFPELLRRVRAVVAHASLTLIGSGPDEGALREAGRDLVAEGALAIEPPVPNELLRARLRDFHVYVLNSEFEGMPQALLEAMSQGCVPVVSDVSSGTRELVRNSETGYRVGVGDLDAFAERIAELDADRARLERISKRAYEALGELGLRVEDMACAYDEQIASLLEQLATGGLERPEEPIGSPPEVVAGLSVFPVPLPVDEPGLGRFPTRGDVEEFRWTSKLRDRAAVVRRRRQPVLLAVRHLAEDYQCELAAELAPALRDEGFDTRVVALRPPPRGARSPSAGGPVHTVCPHRRGGWAGASARVAQLVEAQGPCTYVAFDREAACVAPRLAPLARTVVMSNDDDAAWLLASGLTRYVGGLVFTSPHAEASVLERLPPGCARAWTIPYPVHSLPALGPSREGGEPVILAYLGHLDGLPYAPAAVRPVLAELDRAGMSCRLVLTAPPGKGGAARDAVRRLGVTSVRTEVVEMAGRRNSGHLLEESEILLVPVPLPSVSLLVLDALGHGCVPVGARSPGLEGAVPEELLGNLVPDADASAMARRILDLARSRDRLREVAERARHRIASCYPLPSEVAERWARVLDTVNDASRQAAGASAPGPLFPPYVDAGDPHLPERLLQFPELGSFEHWHEWVDYNTGALLPRPLLRALGLWERGKARLLGSSARARGNDPAAG